MADPEPSTPKKVEENAEALEKKDLGNKAYQAKNFPEAIRLYNEAIALDPDNHVYYSNRSACYGSMGNWNKAADDAKTCIEKDPDFIKGYYRLTLAQIELKEYDAAIETIKAGLKKQPDNPELQKQLRIAKAKKNAAEAVRQRGSAGDMRLSGEEFMEMQEQYRQASKELKEVKGRVAATKRERARSELTLSEIQPLSEETRLFKSLGKMFILSPRSNIVKTLQENMLEQERRSTDLEAKQSYLEARLASHEAILKEASRGLPVAANS